MAGPLLGRPEDVGAWRLEMRGGPALSERRERTREGMASDRLLGGCVLVGQLPEAANTRCWCSGAGQVCGWVPVHPASKDRALRSQQASGDGP